MSTDINDRAAVERRLWNEIETHQTGMLGLTGETSHYQPMTAFVDREASQLWFFTRLETDLVHQVGAGHPAMFVFQQKDLQACVGGELVLDRDPAHLNKYWNAVVAAWYPDGRDDPHLAMLRMDCDDARVWIADGGPVRFAWEIARANATKTQPRVGGQTTLDFHYLGP
jgi:general stress protein 26